MKRSAVTAAGLAALALSACGGGGTSDEDKVKDAIKAVGKDPSTLCTKYATAKILKPAGGEAGCLKLSKDPDAKDPNVKIDSVKVDGDKATAVITSQGGSTKGDKSTLRWVKENGDWKLDGSR